MPDANGLTHWLYAPTAEPVAGKTYWLVVGVHGAGGTGKGAGGVATWATDFDDVIVLGPSFEQPKRDPNAPRPATMPRDIFQMSGPTHEAKLSELIAQVRKTWPGVGHQQTSDAKALGRALLGKVREKK